MKFTAEFDWYSGYWLGFRSGLSSPDALCFRDGSYSCYKNAILWNYFNFWLVVVSFCFICRTTLRCSDFHFNLFFFQIIIPFHVIGLSCGCVSWGLPNLSNLPCNKQSLTWLDFSQLFCLWCFALLFHPGSVIQLCLFFLSSFRVQAIFPSAPDLNVVRQDQMNSLVRYARKVEGDMYDNADSKVCSFTCVSVCLPVCLSASHAIFCNCNKMFLLHCSKTKANRRRPWPVLFLYSGDATN